ncbi:MAG: hypothetical protein HY282_15690 [Nitrospirae bacterium]|nr:hypothetical protein [Candidatus Manganitrophaceae bacterium]
MSWICKEEAGHFQNAPPVTLQLAGERAISRITITVGKMNVKDLFDNNGYANDPPHS